MRVIRLAAMLLLTLSGMRALTAQTVSPESFVRTLYSGYRQASFDVLGKRAPTIFTPAILALIRQDRRTTPKGDVGRLDLDPICWCQDPDGLKLKGVSVVSQSAGSATVVATLQFSEPEPLRVELRLIKTAAGWRVDDVRTKGEPSLRKLLTAPQN